METFSNPPRYMRWHNPITSLPFQHWGKTQDPNWGQKMVKRNGSRGCCKPTVAGRTSHPRWEAQFWTITQRKGEATGRDTQWLFTRPQEGAWKAMNMAKPSKLIQRETKPPSEFYERLCKTYRLHMPIGPQAIGSQMVINVAFVSQAYRRNVRWGDTKWLMNFYTPLNAQYLCWEETCCLNWGHKWPFTPHKRPALWVSSTTYLLSLSINPQDEWRLHNLPEGNQTG